MPSDKRDPWLTIEFKPADSNAVAALSRGAATPEQQIRAMEFIVETICMRGGMSFRPGGPEGDRNTAFAEGRRFVGNTIHRMALIQLTREEQV